MAEHARWHRAGTPVATFGLRRFIRLPHGPPPLCDVHARLAPLPDLARSTSNRAGHLADWRLPQARGIRAHPQPHHCFHGCNVSYPRDLARQAGGWDESFDGAHGYEDVELGARLHRLGAYIVWVPEATVLHLEADAPRRADSRGRARNLELAYQLIPGYRAFRAAEEAVRARVPWVWAARPPSAGARTDGEPREVT